MLTRRAAWPAEAPAASGWPTCPVQAAAKAALCARPPPPQQAGLLVTDGNGRNSAADTGLLAAYPPMETIMKTFAKAAAVLLVAGTFAGCSGMTAKQRNTAVGAGIGAVGGALVTGSTAGTLGGAALGGVIGNVATDKK